MTAIILFQQIEVTTLIQDVVTIFSSNCFLHHKDGLKWALMLYMMIKLRELKS